MKGENIINFLKTEAVQYKGDKLIMKIQACCKNFWVDLIYKETLSKLEKIGIILGVKM